MPEITRPISALEKRTILVFSFLAVLFFLTYFVEDGIRRYHDSLSKPSIRLAADDPVPRVPPGFYLLTVPIFLSLIRPRKFYVATVFVLLWASLFLVSLYIRVDGESFLGGPIPGDPGFLKELYLKAWIWDYVGLAFLAVLLPWLFSILFRLKKQSSSNRRPAESQA